MSSLVHERAAGKPRLLFLTPALPDHRGNGLSMRGVLFLDALSSLYEVVVHVIAIFPPPLHAPSLSLAAGGPAGGRVMLQPAVGREDPLYRMIANIGDPRLRLAALAGYPKPLLCRFTTDQAVAEVQSRYASACFDAVHVFRLYLAPFAAPFLDGSAGGRRPVCRLDLDDLESRTAYRLAELYATNGDAASAYLERAEAEKYERLEDAYLPRFGTVYTASEADRAALAGRYGRRGSFVHAPNAVCVPGDAPHRRQETDGPFTLLFVGTLNYYPNEDAASLLCRDVLPLLRKRVGGRREVRLVIAGALPSAAVRHLAETPGVVVAADVPDLAPLYTGADAVVAPLRAGGGTRIKILEAFAHRRPVIATSIGAEGLDARHEEHLLIADTPSALADACLRVMGYPDEAAAMARRAFDLVRSTYDLERVRRIIARSAAPRGL
jgi:glycosyltransferase involved in cell wall biosynthesis